MKKFKCLTLQTLTCSALMSIVPLNTSAMTWKDWWLTPDQQATQAVSQNHPQKAAQLFNRYDWRAVANYKIAAYQQALDEWDQLLTQMKARSNSIAASTNKISLSDIYYNRGNALAHLERYQEAIVSYEKSLSLDPSNEDTKFNLALIKKLLTQQNQSSSSNDSTQSPSTDNNTSDQNTSKPKTKNNDLTQKSTNDKDSNNSLSDNGYSDNQQPLQQWLNTVHDDPGGLLKQKFLRDEKREELQQYLDKLGETRV